MQHDSADLATRPFRLLARNNAWANLRLLRACAALPQDALEAARTSFFPSLLLTLNHTLIVDWYYVDALEGGTLGPDAVADRMPFRTIPELQAAQGTVDRRLLAVCDGLTAARLGQDVAMIRHEGVVRRDPMDRVLLHLFQHQIHHRGQAHAMLSGTAVQPPQLDEFFLEMDAGLRRGEMAELGLGEE